MSGPARLLVLVRSGEEPVPAEGATTVAIDRRPGEPGAPDPARVLDQILGHDRVVVW